MSQLSGQGTAHWTLNSYVLSWLKLRPWHSTFQISRNRAWLCWCTQPPQYRFFWPFRDFGRHTWQQVDQWSAHTRGLDYSGQDCLPRTCHFDSSQPSQSKPLLYRLCLFCLYPRQKWPQKGQVTSLLPIVHEPAPMWALVWLPSK